jgi:hypothetical protein
LKDEIRASPEGCWKLAGDIIPGKMPKQLMRPGGAREIHQQLIIKNGVVTNT